MKRKKIIKKITNKSIKNNDNIVFYPFALKDDEVIKIYKKRKNTALILPDVGSCLSNTSTFTVSDGTGYNKIQLEVPKDSKQKYTIGFNKGEYKFTVED